MVVRSDQDAHGVRHNSWHQSNNQPDVATYRCEPNNTAIDFQAIDLSELIKKRRELEAAASPVAPVFQSQTRSVIEHTRLPQSIHDLMIDRLHSAQTATLSAKLMDLGEQAELRAHSYTKQRHRTLSILFANLGVCLATGASLAWWPSTVLQVGCIGTALLGDWGLISW